MSITETKIRAALEHHVGPPPLRTMPPGTRPRVRRRQARWVAGVAVIVAAATFAGGALLRALPAHTGPADGGIVRDDPLEFVPNGWPAVDIGDPADGYTMPPDVAGAAGPVRVIASGTVDGDGFSFQSFVSDGTDFVAGDACEGFAGPGLGDFASPDPQPPGAVGGVSSSTCARVHGVPTRKDLFLEIQQSPGAVAGIAADFGFLSSRVSRLEVRLQGGRTISVPVLGSPPGWNGVQAFLFFPPQGAKGTITAIGVDGTELARAPIRGYKSNVTCGCEGVSVQLAPLPRDTRGS